VKVISFEKDSEATWRKRDNLVREMCRKYNVQIIECATHTLYDPDEIFNINNDNPPNTCEELRLSCLKLGDPQKPFPKPDLQFIAANLMSTKDIYDPKIHRVPDLKRFNLEPECEEQNNRLFEGGETKALELLKRRLDYEKESFRGGQVNPNLNKPIIFTKEISLSPYLRFGCLSVKKLYWALKKAYSKVNSRKLKFSFELI
jgi:cryptochrome